MSTKTRFKNLVKSLRNFRIWHRTLGLILAAFLLVSAITGVLLSLKKDVAIIQPPTQKGVATSLAEWKSIDELSRLASDALIKKYPAQKDNVVDRIDVRPSKGIAKAIFEKGNWEVQIDGSTGAIKSIEKRYSDWIESLHDGSIVNDLFKLISMNFLGIGLIFLIATGFWLWYGPKEFRKLKRRSRK